MKHKKHSKFSVSKRNKYEFRTFTFQKRDDAAGSESLTCISATGAIQILQC